MPLDPDVPLKELLLAVLSRLGRMLGLIVAYAVFVLCTLFLMVYGGDKFGIESLSSEDQTILQNYIEWFSVFYTLTLSFVIGQGWRKYQRINSDIDREADELVLLLRTGEMCGASNKKLKDELFRLVILYVERVKIARGRDRRNVGETAELMRQIHIRVKEIVKIQGVPDSIKSMLLHHYCEAYDARGDRFDMLTQRLPRIVWVALIAVSVTWLWGFVWLSCSPVLKFYMSCGVLGVVSFLFFIARDLDNLMTGYFKLNFSPFDNNEFQYSA